MPLNTAVVSVPASRSLETARLIPRKALAHVLPQFELEHPYGGIHGVPHWSRVWYHGRALAAAHDVNPCITAWFAYLHDSRRQNDGYDPLHGHRAADFAVKLRRLGIVDELSTTEFEWLCEAMRLHSDGHTESEMAIMACWDADRLDLARVHITPHPDRLCTRYARRFQTIYQAERFACRKPRRSFRTSADFSTDDR